MKYFFIIFTAIFVIVAISFTSINKKKNTSANSSSKTWQVDFLDNFDTFDSDNWQDQRIWVNNEKQCYVPDNKFGTREVSNGSLKIKVINIGEKIDCDNLDKHGKKQNETQYVAGRIASKNKKEFIKGKWTARLKLWGNGEPSMFPAWWILGAQNNESPLQEADENICWPLTGSGSVEWEGSDLVYRVDDREVYRNVGEGDKYPEAMFAILNYAKITDSPMKGEWVMEVDWVKHESLK